MQKENRHLTMFTRNELNEGRIHWRTTENAWSTFLRLRIGSSKTHCLLYCACQRRESPWGSNVYGTVPEERLFENAVSTRSNLFDKFWPRSVPICNPIWHMFSHLSRFEPAENLHDDQTTEFPIGHSHYGYQPPLSRIIGLACKRLYSKKDFL